MALLLGPPKPVAERATPALPLVVIVLPATRLSDMSAP